MKSIIPVTLVVTMLLPLLGCAALGNNRYVPLNQSDAYYDYLQPSFSEYREVTKRWLSINRTFVTTDYDREIGINMPFELSPTQSSDKAILLVHGLGDSPYSFSDIGNSLRNQGFYVQSLLLPGHGSKPEDLKQATYNDWQTIVDHYANLLKQEYGEVWLGGFSTGGNLVTIHAIKQGGIDGLMLFAAGFQSRAPLLERLAPLASLFTDGYSAEERNIARYTSAPIQSAIAYSNSAVAVRELLNENLVSIPTLLVISEADSVVDPNAVDQLFGKAFTNNRNQLVWYGDSGPDFPRSSVLTMRLDSLRISTGSHMSPLFAPSNPYYGENGEHRMCMNSFDNKAITRCESGEEVWYSAWGFEEPGKIHARLTWNPHYTELEQSIANIVGAN